MGKADREKKSPEIAKLTTQSIVFFKGRINEICVNYLHSLFQTFQPRPSLKNCFFLLYPYPVYFGWVGR